EKDKKVRPTGEEEELAMRVLHRVHMLRKDVPSSNGYKRARRNEIRSLVYRLGSPAFFITITPSDVDGLLFQLAVNDYKNAPDILQGSTRTSRFKRAMLVADNPATAASVFHRIMLRFRDIILRIENGAGLFGKCTGWYGMVEAQGRGTLHCHMLIWIEGNPAPNQLWELLTADKEHFKTRMLDWLERLIHTELPGQTAIVEEPNGALPMPKRSKDEIDPRSVASPDLRPFQHNWCQVFERRVTDLVVCNNWHEHRATCWIHLRPGEPRTDDKCRMRIDGTTRAISEIDEETGSILLRRLHPRINEYNDVVMFLLGCNMDIQYLGSGEASKAALYYITDYITKPSLKVHAGLSALIYALEKNRNKFAQVPDAPEEVVSKSLLTKIVNSMLSRMEMSLQQIMSFYVGGGDYYTQHHFARLNWGSFSSELRRLEDCANGQVQQPGASSDVDDMDNALEVDLLQSAPVDEDNEQLSAHLLLSVVQGHITASNQYHDYVLRPEDEPFGSLCLYDFVSLCEKI
ncbi:hypothetical protein CALCODRAFT_415023, partial [Calocera cornea HHB12733]